MWHAGASGDEKKMGARGSRSRPSPAILFSPSHTSQVSTGPAGRDSPPVDIWVLENMIEYRRDGPFFFLAPKYEIWMPNVTSNNSAIEKQSSLPIQLCALATRAK